MCTYLKNPFSILESQSIICQIGLTQCQDNMAMNIFALFHSKRQTTQVSTQKDTPSWSGTLGSVMDWQNIVLLLSLSNHAFCGTQTRLNVLFAPFHLSVWNPFSSRASMYTSTETLLLDIPCLLELYFSYCNSFSTAGGDTDLCIYGLQSIP